MGAGFSRRSKRLLRGNKQYFCKLSAGRGYKARDRGPRRRTRSTSRSPTERNAVDMPGSVAAVERWWELRAKAHLQRDLCPDWPLPSCRGHRVSVLSFPDNLLIDCTIRPRECASRRRNGKQRKPQSGRRPQPISRWLWGRRQRSASRPVRRPGARTAS